MLFRGRKGDPHLEPPFLSSYSAGIASPDQRVAARLQHRLHPSHHEPWSLVPSSLLLLLLPPPLLLCLARSSLLGRTSSGNTVPGSKRGDPPTPPSSIPVPFFRWRSAPAATSEPDITAAAAAAAAATATTVPTITTHGGMDATCVGALLRPFDPGKRCWRSTRRGKAVPRVDLPFDRGKAWRVTGFVLKVSSCLSFGLCRKRLENRVLETALVSCRSAHENHGGGEYDIMIHDAAQAELWSFRAVRSHS